MFDGVTAPIGEERADVDESFKLISIKAVYNLQDTTIDFFWKYFNVIKDNKNNNMGKDSLNQQRDYWHKKIRERAKATVFKDMYVNKWGFWDQNRNFINEWKDSIAPKTCRFKRDSNHEDPANWNDNKIKLALKVMWRRRQGKCKAKWKKRPGGEWKSSSSTPSLFIDYDYHDKYDMDNKYRLMYMYHDHNMYDNYLIFDISIFMMLIICIICILCGGFIGYIAALIRDKEIIKFNH